MSTGSVHGWGVGDWWFAQAARAPGRQHMGHEQPCDVMGAYRELVDITWHALTTSPNNAILDSGAKSGMNGSGSPGGMRYGARCSANKPPCPYSFSLLLIVINSHKKMINGMILSHYFHK